MKQPKNKDYTFSFESSKSTATVFEALLNVKGWWSGFFNEEIKGNFNSVNDQFTFKAGDGVHYSKQQMVELVPHKKVVWMVTESNLSFLEHPDEWTNTNFGFEISYQSDKAQITFTHVGLTPSIECYKNCSTAWTAYMKKLAERLK